MIDDDIKDSNEKLIGDLYSDIKDSSDDETNVNELLELYRNLVQSICPEVDVEDIEYITIDGTKNESEDRGLDFEVL